MTLGVAAGIFAPDSAVDFAERKFSELTFSVSQKATASSVGTDTASFPLCGSGTRYTCVVDGDTVWLRGEKIRLALIDAPEKHDPKCSQEALQAAEATRRLADLLNDKEWRFERRGKDRYGRTLGVFWIDDRAVGEILISEGLARRWDGQRHPWC